jgi:hypothetical protein
LLLYQDDVCLYTIVLNKKKQKKKLTLDSNHSLTG